LNFKKKILLTGGAGFIGCHLTTLLVKKYPEYLIVVFDSLTYAGNLSNLSALKSEANFQFYKGDICSDLDLKKAFKDFDITDVIHLAAESHVDRSITQPTQFLETNILGTAKLLNHCRENWSSKGEHLFYHVSTDEVFGSLGQNGEFNESTAYDPKSPYSASKASSDHVVRAYGHTYDFPYIISNCSNNYGPNQFPEKLIPLMINNIKEQKKLPVYGDGKNVRDWLWVTDHAIAIDSIFHQGKVGETYCVGGDEEMSNIDMVHLLIELVDHELERTSGLSKNLISFVEDRKGHDFRYAIDSSKLRSELNWRPTVNLKEGLTQTVKWYLSNSDWLRNVTSGEYLEYYVKHYRTE